jgi:YbgC/YbaW family acyl-CoA thioester hydrolase
MAQDNPAVITGARVIVQRYVAWGETDAAGHNHFAAAFRWLEESEHALYRCLGFSAEFIDRVPRVHIDIDYRDRLYFGQLIEVELGVVSVGGSSCRFAMRVRREGVEVISASYVVVHVAGTTEGGAPWPAELRSALESDVAYRVSEKVE